MEASNALSNALVRNWWLVLLRGVAAVLFGIITFVAPGRSLAAVVLVFGAYAFADGVLALVSLFRRRVRAQRWWGIHVVAGIAGIVVGLVTFLLPSVTALGFLIVTASWAIVTGIFEVVAAIRLRRLIKGEWLLALGGLMSIALGVLLVMYPAAGLLTIVLWTGAYALIFGAILVALAIRLRFWRKSSGPLTGEASTTRGQPHGPPATAGGVSPG